MTVPTLRYRKGDSALLTGHFLEQVAQEYGNSVKSIQKDAQKELEGFQWTGNIRELRNVVERLVIMSGEEITKKDVLKYVEN